jgi:hypothetical protein
MANDLQMKKELSLETTEILEITAITASTEIDTATTDTMKKNMKHPSTLVCTAWAATLQSTQPTIPIITLACTT